MRDFIEQSLEISIQQTLDAAVSQTAHSRNYIDNFRSTIILSALRASTSDTPDFGDAIQLS